MIETTVLDWLTSGLSVPVAMETPAGPPDSYVLIEKLGSGKTNCLSRARIAVQSLAPSLYGAASLSYDVVTLMDRLPELSRVFMVRLDGDYNHTDPKSRKYRYQAVFTIYYKED